MQPFFALKVLGLSEYPRLMHFGGEHSLIAPCDTNLNFQPKFELEYLF